MADPLQIPMGLAISWVNHIAQLSWDTQPDATSFRVYRATYPDVTTVLLATVTADNEYTDLTADPALTYKYQITSYDPVAPDESAKCDAVYLLSETPAVVESAIDIVTPFFTNNPFLENAVYRPLNGYPVTIPIYYIDPSSEPRISGIAFSTSELSAICRTSDISSATDKDTIVINSVTHYIKEVNPDGMGMTVLILSKDPVV